MEHIKCQPPVSFYSRSVCRGALILINFIFTFIIDQKDVRTISIQWFFGNASSAERGPRDFDLMGDAGLWKFKICSSCAKTMKMTNKSIPTEKYNKWIADAPLLGRTAPSSLSTTFLSLSRESAQMVCTAKHPRVKQFHVEKSIHSSSSLM